MNNNTLTRYYSLSALSVHHYSSSFFDLHLVIHLFGFVMGNCCCWREPSIRSVSPNAKPEYGSSSGKSRKGYIVKLPSTPAEVEDLRRCMATNPLIVFSFDVLKTMTGNFRDDYMLGRGGFGSVYKGYICDDLGQGLEPIPVAVKVHGGNKSLQGHREWLAEVIMLGQLSHPNLVKLIGYCCEDKQRVLIYEYMCRGSVEDNLFSSKKRVFVNCIYTAAYPPPFLGLWIISVIRCRNMVVAELAIPLPWCTRMKIVFGAAKGLEFLHNAEKPVIYRDFKTANILLDEDYDAKLSDFGLAKDGPEGDNSHVSTRVMGTYGYAAPEYVMTGHLTSSSDVYSFGVVLLELITGKRCLDKFRAAHQQNLTEWAIPLILEKKLDEIVDPRLEGNYPMKGVQKAAMLAYHCLNQNPKARPLMRDVVDSLEPLQLSNHRRFSNDNSSFEEFR